MLSCDELVDLRALGSLGLLHERLLPQLPLKPLKSVLQLVCLYLSAVREGERLDRHVVIADKGCYVSCFVFIEEIASVFEWLVERAGRCD